MAREVKRNLCKQHDPMMMIMISFQVINLFDDCHLFTHASSISSSIPGRVIPKTLNMVLDTSLLNTQQHKVRIEGKAKQSMKRSCALPVVA